MNPPPLQDLTEAFNSIISMMLSMLRARGLRGLLDLPKMLITAIYLRRLGREFSALVAAFQAGTLPPLPPATVLPERQAAPAHTAEPDPAASDRPAHRAVPRRATGMRRAPAASPPPAAPATPARRFRAPTPWRRQDSARPRRPPHPRAINGLSARARAIARMP